MTLSEILEQTHTIPVTASVDKWGCYIVKAGEAELFYQSESEFELILSNLVVRDDNDYIRRMQLSDLTIECSTDGLLYDEYKGLIAEVIIYAKYFPNDQKK